VPLALLRPAVLSLARTPPAAPFDAAVPRATARCPLAGGAVRAPLDALPLPLDALPLEALPLGDGRGVACCPSDDALCEGALRNDEDDELSLKFTRCSGADARKLRSPTPIDGDDTADTDGDIDPPLLLEPLLLEPPLLAMLPPPPPPPLLDAAPPPPPDEPPRSALPAPGSGRCASAGPAVNRSTARKLPSLTLESFIKCVSRGSLCNRTATNGSPKYNV
jgi:hypothetical protein